MPFSFNLFQSGMNDHIKSGIRPPRAISRFLWSHPHLYRGYAKLRHGVDIFNRDGDLILEGFPRSGNSFAVRMIDLTQNKRIKCLSHSHCPPYILAPLESNLPVCLTLRRAEESVISWTIMRKLPVNVVMELYIDFHRVLFDERTRMLVLNFTTITKDFGTVLRLINRRFALNLDIPLDMAPFEKEALAMIDRHYEQQPEGFDPLKVARPHPKRDEAKAAVRAELQTRANARLLAECNELYSAFESEAQRALQSLPASACTA